MSDRSDPIEGDRFLTVECHLYIWNSVGSCGDHLDHHLGFVVSFLLEISFSHALRFVEFILQSMLI